MASRQRVIIALDLDAFYVAASRKRDPSLVGLPVGIKQKNILATCSYEARRRGVAKLDGVRDALTKCPELVLVDGEDLSYFRDVSRQVFRLVTRFLKGVSVERLGMDELFCDVTDFLDEWAGPAAADDDSFVGNLLPSNAATPPRASHAAKLRRASHLALEVRSLVSQQINLTCSAGIASSKLVAKMAGNVHKPNQQTVFAPLDETADEAVRLFLDPYPLRQINGFGSSIVRQLCDSIADPHSPSPSTIDASQLTVALARQVFDREKLIGLFGARIGNRLWQLVLGSDDEPVQPSPEIPAQISIEDTYRVPLHTESAVKAQILTLSTSLLRRLETELRVSDSDDDSVPALPELVPYEKPLDEWIDRGIQATIRDYHRVTSSQELLAATAAAGQQPFEWKRFPLSLRLSISQKKFVRVSRQTRMPVDIFDTAVPRPQRALVLAASVQALFRTIVNAKEDFALRLINIAATDLVAKRPSRGIGDFLQKQLPLASLSGAGAGVGDEDAMVNAPAKEGGEVAKSATGAADPSVANGQGSSSDQSQERIDADVFRQLPSDLQAELAAHYGLDPSLLVPLSEYEEQEREMKEEVATEEVKGKSREGQDALVCPLCAQSMLPYLQHDHARWPLRGLPMEEWLDHDDDEEQQEEQEGDWQDMSELE
ncbi:DNA/RNA polymerase [Acaromyces ingoldii]|uniref:DNA/RNA polymerase n=1 Tax=Acaromyces ingoldii TaxID=215250 RepID=A0A316YYA2_9BASI|nr:DNA/RNA polymerase [Acaromyces ingoldii]PWN94072.1 DNA/RNA polymerase [Acaromyces ingoldii]